MFRRREYLGYTGILLNKYKSTLEISLLFVPRYVRLLSYFLTHALGVSVSNAVLLKMDCVTFFELLLENDFS